MYLFVKLWMIDEALCFLAGLVNELVGVWASECFGLAKHSFFSAGVARFGLFDGCFARELSIAALNWRSGVLVFDEALTFSNWYRR